MPAGFLPNRRAPMPLKVGRPSRDRAKCKAQRRARKAGR